MGILTASPFSVLYSTFTARVKASNGGIARIVGLGRRKTVKLRIAEQLERWQARCEVGVPSLIGKIGDV